MREPRDIGGRAGQDRGADGVERPLRRLERRGGGLFLAERVGAAELQRHVGFADDAQRDGIGEALARWRQGYGRIDAARLQRQFLGQRRRVDEREQQRLGERKRCRPQPFAAVDANEAETAQRCIGAERRPVRAGQFDQRQPKRRHGAARIAVQRRDLVARDRIERGPGPEQQQVAPEGVESEAFGDDIGAGARRRRLAAVEPACHSGKGIGERPQFRRSRHDRSTSGPMMRPKLGCWGSIPTSGCEAKPSTSTRAR